MADAGRILIIPKGDYDANSTYEKLDLVKHKGTSWLAKKDVTAVEPSEENAEYWQSMFGISIADNLDTEVVGQALDARQGKILDEKIDSQGAVLDEKIETLNNILECETIYSGDFTVYKYTNGKMIIEWLKELEAEIPLSNQNSGVFYGLVDFIDAFPVEFIDRPLVTSIGITHSDQHSPFVNVTVDSVNRIRFDRCIIWTGVFTTLVVGDIIFVRFEGRWK